MDNKKSKIDFKIVVIVILALSLVLVWRHFIKTCVDTNSYSLEEIAHKYYEDDIASFIKKNVKDYYDADDVSKWYGAKISYNYSYNTNSSSSSSDFDIQDYKDTHSFDDVFDVYSEEIWQWAIDNFDEIAETVWY